MTMMMQRRQYFIAYKIERHAIGIVSLLFIIITIRYEDKRKNCQFIFNYEYNRHKCLHKYFL